MISLILITLASIHLIASPANAAGSITDRVSFTIEDFYKANEKYQAGEYSEAVKMYLGLSESGFRSGNLYYNLGNAYLKEGRLGRAILNYDRSKRYMRADSDLLSNIRYAKTLMKRPDPPSNAFIAVQWLDNVFDHITLRQAVALATIWYCLIIGYFILTKVLKRYMCHSTPTLVCMILILAVMVIPIRRKIYDLEKGGIVVDKITDARLEPHKAATVNYPLYEGMTVYILRKRGEWLRIKASDGRIGWIPADSAEIIGM